MTLFKADYITLEITEVEIIRDTGLFVIEKGKTVKDKKHSDSHGYFFTKQNAKDFMLFRLDQQRTEFMNCLYRVERNLEKARQL
jgi:hypothetical protein